MKNKLNFFLFCLSLFSHHFVNAYETNVYLKQESATLAPYNQFDLYAADKQNIQDIIRRVAEYQLKAYGETPGGSWTVGTFFSSFIPAYKITGDKWYLDQATKWGEFTQWDIHHSLDADDVCPGQTYLDLYFLSGDKEMIATLDKKLSKAYFNRTTLKSGELREWEKEEKPFIGRNIWSWADALYMAPPVFARLGKATGNKEYYSVLHKLYWDATEFLYDPDERLYFRNSKVETEKLSSPNGKKVFWSRGNGWVFGGLARLIDYLPENDPFKAKYIKMLQDMAFSLAEYQQTDGLWRSSLNDPHWFPTKETSGSAFFVYAMAKGIRKGWLPKSYFLPVVIKGWSGLVSAVSAEGKLGYSQVVAGDPQEVRARDGVDYAHGAFILAATEVYQLTLKEEINALASNSLKPRLVVKDGAWESYHENPVVAHKGVFFANYKKLNGNTGITAFTTNVWPNVSAYARKEKILSFNTSNADAYIASIVPTSDDELLSVYGSHYKRHISLPLWSSMVPEKETVVNQKEVVGYHSVFNMEGDKRLYQFSTGDSFQPMLSLSDDNGETWTKAVNFLAINNIKNKRPFVKYASNGIDRIDIMLTDSNNSQVNSNTLYHFYYQQGVFYRTNGEKIASLKQVQTTPVLLTQLSTVKKSKFIQLQDLELVNNQPKASYLTLTPQGKYEFWFSGYLNNVWQSFKLGEAGIHPANVNKPYFGGITLHPTLENTFVVSTNVNPKTGITLADGLYQLFKGTLIDGRILWRQLTFDPVFDHFRPTISRGSLQGLFWVTGSYKNTVDFQTDILMSEAF